MLFFRKREANRTPNITPVDPAGPDCYQNGTKPCEFANLSTLVGGERLSNTKSTCPQVENKLGKLRLMSDRWGGLEWPLTQKELVACLLVSLEDRAASDQVAGEVTAHQAYNRYGP